MMTSFLLDSLLVSGEIGETTFRRIVVRPMRALIVVILVGAAAPHAPASVEDRRTKSDLEQFYGAEYPKVSEGQREKLARDAIRAQESGVCNLHHVRMQKKRVPVHYGLVVADDPYYLAQLCYFPNARAYVNGGCDIPSRDFQKDRSWRFVCPACKRAQRKWALVQPKSDWSKDILANR